MVVATVIHVSDWKSLLLFIVQWWHVIGLGLDLTCNHLACSVFLQTVAPAHGRHCMAAASGKGPSHDLCSNWSDLRNTIKNRCHVFQKNVIRGVTVMVHTSVRRSRSFNALEHVCTHGTLAAMLKSFTCLSRSPEVGLSAFSNTDSFEHGWFLQIILKLMFDRSLLRYSCTSWLSCSCPPFFLRLPFTQKETLKKVVWQISQVSGPWCSRSQHIDECNVCGKKEWSCFDIPTTRYRRRKCTLVWLGPGTGQLEAESTLAASLPRRTPNQRVRFDWFGLRSCEASALHPYLLSNLDQDQSGISRFPCCVLLVQLSWVGQSTSQEYDK